jgi:hypothetical protein
MSEFSVRLARPDDEHEILALFNSIFAEGNPAYVPRSIEAWRHIYPDNPAGAEILVAEDEAGKLIANYSALAYHCSVRGQRLRCAQAVDTCVAPEWRGSLRRNSVFVTIARAYCEIFGETNAEYTNEYLFGLPNEKAFGVGTRIVGYKPVHCPMPSLVREFDRAWVDEMARRGADVEVTESSADDADLAAMGALFEAHIDQVPLGIWKDAAHLAWRYRDWPERPYRFLLARRGGDLVGALVYRLGWMGQPIVPLLDWIGPGDDEGALAGLLARVGDITLQAGGDKLETWLTPCAAQRPTLESLGLFHQESLFNLCIMVYSELFDLPWARDNWVLTMGDSDIY